jgi:hypothetical protein
MVEDYNEISFSCPNCDKWINCVKKCDCGFMTGKLLETLQARFIFNEENKKGNKISMKEARLKTKIQKDFKNELD